MGVVLTPLRLAVETVRAVVAIPKIIVRAPEMVDSLDRLATDIIPKLIAGAEPLARATSPLADVVSRRGGRAPGDIPSDDVAAVDTVIVTQPDT